LVLFCLLLRAESGLAFASGSAATGTVLNTLATGSHVISIDDVYGGTQRFFRRVAAPTYNMKFSFVDFTQEGALEAAFTPETKLVWCETPTNPGMCLYLYPAFLVDVAFSTCHALLSIHSHFHFVGAGCFCCRPEDRRH
jgi:O-acetylhomoserine/O-acetylserine sulfhydrylase-like pyridoxal-dependent enzyme